MRALQAFIDRVHGKGKGVIIDAFDATTGGMEYSLAHYLLISNGRDGVGQIDMTPDNWWTGWDTDLGAALGGRYDWQGLQRRDFQGGMALVNDPGAPARTVQLPSAMTTIDGRTVTSVTVGGGRGVVLKGAGQSAQPSPAPAARRHRPRPGSGATPGTSPATGATGSTCTKVRVTYPTLMWNAKRRQLVKAKGTTTVCIPASLGSRARRDAVKQARESARRKSLRQAKAARREAVPRRGSEGGRRRLSVTTPARKRRLTCAGGRRTPLRSGVRPAPRSGASRGRRTALLRSGGECLGVPGEPVGLRDRRALELIEQHPLVRPVDARVAVAGADDERLAATGRRERRDDRDRPAAPGHHRLGAVGSGPASRAALHAGPSEGPANPSPVTLGVTVSSSP